VADEKEETKPETKAPETVRVTYSGSYGPEARISGVYCSTSSGPFEFIVDEHTTNLIKAGVFVLHTDPPPAEQAPQEQSGEKTPQTGDPVTPPQSESQPPESGAGDDTATGGDPASPKNRRKAS
jgi:hypothetical protein